MGVIILTRAIFFGYRFYAALAKFTIAIINAVGPYDRF